jgi:hypothetical protein
MIAWGNTTDRILLLLQEGEMTKIQICSALGLTHDDVASVLTRLRRVSKKFGKRIYICGWQREAIGKKYHLRPVFAVGSKVDKPKPPAFTHQERAAKTHRKRMLIKRSQIFRIAA